ncbi:response regulator [Zunongwangia sp.]|uniref:response regulator n=1 Tax=Zunongwangia sp. TaxID=1965325 RepID=UPI003AA8DB70
MLEVILVDDDPIVLLMQKRVVVRCGIHTSPLIFKSGSELFKYFEEQKIEDDKSYLILLDINMPGLSGWDVMDKFFNHPFKDNIHVIMVTSSIDLKDRNKANTYDKIIGYIEKPVTLNNCYAIKNLEPINSYFSES